MECSFRELGYSLNGGYAEQLHFDGINLAIGGSLRRLRQSRSALAAIEARRGACRCGYAVLAALQWVVFRFWELQRAPEVVDQP